MASVLITGTNSGIGLATAVALGRAGHTVYATVRDLGRATKLTQIVHEERLPVSIMTMDVDSDESIKQATTRIYDRGATIDVLVNNAGIERLGSIEETPIEAFRAVMETNYFGALRCIKAVLPRMRMQHNGCIINMGSVCGQMSLLPLTPYTASKYALEALSEALAQEVKTANNRVAIVEPGVIGTVMADGWISTRSKMTTGTSGLRRTSAWTHALGNEVPAGQFASASRPLTRHCNEEYSYDIPGHRTCTRKAGAPAAPI
jgi:NAD(P)-dependent dehydrogenase (short-subunit alcohol dehydrogenase family)